MRQLLIGFFLLIFGFVLLTGCQPTQLEEFIQASSAMEPTIKAGSKVLVNTKTTQIRFSDIVLYVKENQPDDVFISRIVGLPNQSIQLNEKGLLVNGKLVELQYMPDEKSLKSSNYAYRSAFLLNEESFFVIGDNMANSFDSRFWGPLKKSQIKGVVVEVRDLNQSAAP